MKNIGFLGSGFALYGYLKYFSNKSYKLYTLKKYKKIIKYRKDLKKILTKITFKNSDNDILKHSDEVVFARRPIDQEKFIKKIIKKKFKIKHYYFEKPLCSNPNSSLKNFKSLKKKRIKFSTGYLFFYTKFYQKFSKNFKKSLNINWEFMSYDLRKKNRNSWKFDISKGGGPLRFYGIHLISIIAQKYKEYSGIKSVIIFKNKIPIIWKCTLTINKKIKIQINIDTFSSVNKFSLNTDKKLLYNANSPLGNKNEKHVSDYRIKFIKKMVKDSNNYFNYKNYENSIVLWKKIESKTTFIYEM